MAKCIFKHKTLYFKTLGNKTTYFEIKNDCLNFVAESGVKNGILVVSSPHTTCATMFEEMTHDIDALGDEFLLADLNKGLNKIFPRQLTRDDYYKYPGQAHIDWCMENIPGATTREHPEGLLNGDAHLKATLLGADKTFIIKDGELLIGTYGYIYFVDFDWNKPRERKCNLMIMGKE